MKFNYYTLASMKRASPIIVPLNNYLASNDDSTKPLNQQPSSLDFRHKIANYFIKSDERTSSGIQNFKFNQPLNFGKKQKNLANNATKNSDSKSLKSLKGTESITTVEQWRNNRKWLVRILSIWFLVAISLLINCVVMV